MSFTLDVDSLFFNKKIGITGNGPGGIGDALIKSSFPENFYKNYNNKVIDLDKHWIYDSNPYVVRNEDPEIIIDFYRDQLVIIDMGIRISHKSNAAEFCWNYKVPNIFLRHPRLYIFEDEPQILNRLVIHVKGVTNGLMAQHVIDHIPSNYKNYEIIQIGMPNEPQVKNSIDKRGLSKLDTIKIISSAAIYIGVDSGFYHAANCYPRVRKKIVLNYDEERLNKIIPLDISNNFEWLDFNTEYFNIYHKDIGITNSFLKI
jgi:hypothetical protein